MGGQYNSTRLENLCYHIRVAQRQKLFRGLLMIDVKASTCVVETLVEIVAEPRRSSRLRTKPVRFEDKVLLL